MTKGISGQPVRPPVILGGNGDIGRTVLQQLLAAGVVPAGMVLTSRRLEDITARDTTAKMIARNFTPEGEARVLEDVELTGGPNPVLWVGDIKIPVFTSDNQHEIFQEGHPVIDATGKHKKRALLEPILAAGAKFVVVTSPIHEEEGIATVVYGVNDDAKKFDKAWREGLLSTSSCTTTAVTSFLGPILGNSRLDVSGALVDIKHARTKSNPPEEIANNILLTSSGGIKEIPKVLGVKPDRLMFYLVCARANVACGSVAGVTLLFGPKFRASKQDLRANVIKSLRTGRSNYVIDNGINDTKGVVGRTESAIINLNEMKPRTVPGVGSVVTGIDVFYDNVAGYTRSVLDSYKIMAAKLDSGTKTAKKSTKQKRARQPA